MRQGRLVLSDYRWEPSTPQPWMSESLCAQTDPEAFFPEKGGSTQAAKALCAECPVRAQCLAFALANDEHYGIWGGLAPKARRALKVGAA